MDCVILAGGYAKRMSPLTDNQPKHLLPIGPKPMLQYVLDNLAGTEGLRNIYLSTNARFRDHFGDFLAGYRASMSIKLVVEETRSEQEKLGSIGALALIASSEKLDDDLMIIGGDNLFEFSLNDMVAFYRRKKGTVVALYDVGLAAKSGLYGIASVDRNDTIVAFQEKPLLLAATACYIFSRNGIGLLKEYIREKNNADAMGHFIQWLLHKKEPVHGFSFTGSWFDIGSIKSYEQANAYYSGLGRTTA